MVRPPAEKDFVPLISKVEAPCVTFSLALEHPGILEDMDMCLTRFIACAGPMAFKEI